MSVFEHPSFDDHESVTFAADPACQLRCVIAVHSTALGPAGGGTRFWSYASSADALTDALRLSRAMSYKNAMADLPLGGGKGVVMRPPGVFERETLFEAYGRAIERLGGRYITAEDVGVGVDDMRAVRRSTRFVAGLAEGAAASGDPSPLTAQGVFLGIQSIARRVLDRSDLDGVRVAVQGVGHVGAEVCRRLHEAGASLIVTDIDAAAVAAVADRYGATVVAPDAIYDIDADVFAPCALGATIDPDTVERLRVKAVAGGANNQLASPAMGVRLAERGVLYAPDYVINGGGIINVAAEISGAYDPAWVQDKIVQLNATLEAVFDRAAVEGRPTDQVADDMARERIARAAAD